MSVYRAARNLSYQDRTPSWGEPELLMMVKGQDLIGTPLSVRPQIFCLWTWKSVEWLEGSRAGFASVAYKLWWRNKLVELCLTLASQSRRHGRLTTSSTCFRCSPYP